MKKLSVTTNYINVNNNVSFTICLLSDLHISKNFNMHKLDIIKNKITELKPNYICVAGDLIDTSLFLKKRPDKVQKLLEFIEYLASICPVIIVRGNHDIKYKKELKTYNLKLWQDISNIKGVYLSNNDLTYEDDNIYICNFENNINYYYKSEKRNKKLLIKGLQSINNEKMAKTKVLLIHSPILITDQDILKYINSYDLVLCGHMHNGVVPPLLNKLIKNNRGLIAPGKKLFPDNARGYKQINYENHIVNLIISGGITKLSEVNGLISLFNFIYPMDINNIVIN